MRHSLNLNMEDADMLPLGLLAPGEMAEVVELTSGKPSCHRCGCQGGDSEGRCHLGDLGLRVGKTVEVLNSCGRGALLVKVDNSRIALSRGLVPPESPLGRGA